METWGAKGVGKERRGYQGNHMNIYEVIRKEEEGEVGVP